MRRVVGLFLLGFFLPASALAGEADIVDVKAVRQQGNTFRFEVTLRHADTGWKHYANGWTVHDPQGKMLAKRTLHHPHEHEQPFTRSLSGVKISPEIKTVTIRAHDSVHGTGGREMQVVLPR